MKDHEKVSFIDELEEARRDAEEMGISLQEYLLLRILRELEQIPYRGE